MKLIFIIYMYVYITLLLYIYIYGRVCFIGSRRNARNKGSRRRKKKEKNITRKIKKYINCSTVNFKLILVC